MVKAIGWDKKRWNIFTVIRDKIVVKINFFEKYKSGNYIL